MIQVSLLVILVAVTLLALGLTSGSSNLLIASIAASLLAAVALVIGARRTASVRRATTGRPPEAEPAEREADGPSPQFAAEFAAARPGTSSAEFGAAGPGAASPGPSAEFGAAMPGAASPGPSAEFGAAGPGAASPAPSAEFVAAPAGAASSAPADDSSAPAAASGPRPAGHDYPAAEPADDVESAEDETPWPAGDQVYATQPLTEPEVAAATGADYDWASSAIHGARSDRPDENAWRRDTHAEAAAHADAPDPHDEFGEADADDPDDEPLPQSVRPADAVRVARLDAEVLVVDGRPRYHLADCPHLVGRLTEPIPVNEAVELGFSPCGRCRPVDRLVAASARL